MARSSAAPTSSAYRHSFEPVAVMPALPNDDAIVRLVGALLLECNDEWAVQRARYMTLETMTPMKDDLVIGLPAMAR